MENTPQPTKTVHAVVTWRSCHDVEVPADWEGSLMDLPEDALDEITSQNAELWDWSVA